MSEGLGESIAKIRMYIVAFRQMEESIGQVKEAAESLQEPQEVAEARVAAYRRKLGELGARMAREACSEGKRAVMARSMVFGHRLSGHDVEELLDFGEVEQELAGAIGELEAAVKGQEYWASEWARECGW